MYDVVLVDDESMELKLLSKIVDWNAYQMRIALATDNPFEALEYITENSPSIVITDIKMPGMTGIELAERIRNFNSNIIILFISAFTDFEYVKKALRLEVSDYILKPITKENIEECCEHTKEKLEKIFMPNDDPGLKSLLCQQVIYDYISGINTNVSDIENKLTENDVFISFDTSECAAVQIKINNMAEYLQTSWSYGTDRLYSAIINLMRSEEFYIIPISYSFNVINAIAIQHQRENCSFDKTLGNALKSAKDNSEKLLKVFIETEILMKSNGLESGRTELAKYFMLPDAETNGNPENASTAITRAKEYICKNYNKDITLTEIADYVYLTPYYFSKLFKSKTGEKFIDYLNRVRIEKSKELLLISEMKVADIYKKVGYNSKNHFYKMFKLFCGITPQEYRKKFFNG